MGKAAERHSGGNLRIAVAWATLGGVAKLRETCGEHMSNVQIVLSGNSGLSEVEGVIALRRDLGAEVYVAFRNDIELFHPKVYVFEGGADPGAATIFAGSLNTTEPGFLMNSEAMLEVAVETETRHLAEDAITNADRLFSELTDPDNEYVHKVTGDDVLEKLVRAGLLVTRRTARKRRRKERRSRSASSRRRREGIAVATPALVERPTFEVPDLPFEEPEDDDVEERSAASPVPVTASDDSIFDIVFVRTLTENDVAKLRREQKGTFEPDLGEGPRDVHPEFWGWEEGATTAEKENGPVGEYELVRRKKARLEWTSPARVISSKTGPEGEVIGFRLWYRPDREGHAAEHRMTPLMGPDRKTIKDYVPEDFDDDSLMVVERTEEEGFEFVIRLLTARDENYDTYQKVAVHKNPAHKYGYGRKPSAA